MPRPEEDSAFAAFQRTGQPEQLARVFDLCAPRLLLVAMRRLGTIEPVVGQQEIRVTLRAPIPGR